jgi:hypothetical protein
MGWSRESRQRALQRKINLVGHGLTGHFCETVYAVASNVYVARREIAVLPAYFAKNSGKNWYGKTSAMI